jgi:N-acetylglutamate synthase-like GNAT family acetyltransferase
MADIYVKKAADRLLEYVPDFEHGGGKVSSPQGQLKDLSVEQVAPNIVIFHDPNGNFLKSAGWTMVYFMDSEQAARDMKDSKIDYPMFIPGSLDMQFSGYSMLDAIWKKGKAPRGETPENRRSRESKRHVVGALEAYVTPDGIYVDYLSVRPGWRRNTIATKMMQALKNEFPDREMTHSKATDQGAKFLKATGQYNPHEKEELKPQQEHIEAILSELIDEAGPGMKPSRKQVLRGDFSVADTGDRPNPKKRSFLRKPPVSIEAAPTEEEIHWYTRQGFSRVMAKILALEKRQRDVKEAQKARKRYSAVPRTR